MSVDDIDVSDKTRLQVTDLLKGSPGSRVRLKFARDGKDTESAESAVMDFSALADLSMLSIPDFPTISLPDWSFTPGKAVWSGVSLSGHGETGKNGRNNRFIFEVSMLRSGTRPGILKSIRNSTNHSQKLHSLNPVRPESRQNADLQLSTPQVHCKNLKSSASSTASDDAGRQSKIRYAS